VGGPFFNSAFLNQKKWAQEKSFKNLRQFFPAKPKVWNPELKNLGKIGGPMEVFKFVDRNSSLGWAFLNPQNLKYREKNFPGLRRNPFLNIAK